MKIKSLGLALVVCLASPLCLAQNFGVGLIVGLPTGLSFKNYLSESRAIDAALSWSTSGRDRIYLHSDYLFEERGRFQVQEVSLDLYYGLGLTLISREEKEDEDKTEMAVGPRIPVGVRHRFKEYPIEVFGELALQVELIPDSEFGLGVGLGGRYYF